MPACHWIADPFRETTGQREDTRMKILVLSDSHGEVEAMVRAVKRIGPEMIFHLGDGWRDAEIVAEKYPDIPFYQVAGNCDYRYRKHTEQTVLVHGKKLFLCHGHTYNIKQTFYDADELAEREGLDAFLFGHTHSPLVEKRGRTLFMNPGSIGMGYPPSFGVLTVDENRVDARIYQLKVGSGFPAGIF